MPAAEKEVRRAICWRVDREERQLLTERAAEATVGVVRTDASEAHAWHPRPGRARSGWAWVRSQSDRPLLSPDVKRSQSVRLCDARRRRIQDTSGDAQTVRWSIPSERLGAATCAIGASVSGVISVRPEQRRGRRSRVIATVAKRSSGAGSGQRVLRRRSIAGGVGTGPSEAIVGRAGEMHDFVSNQGFGAGWLEISGRATRTARWTRAYDLDPW